VAKNRENELWPILSVRLPDPDTKSEIRAASTAAGYPSVNQWVLAAIASKLKEESEGAQPLPVMGEGARAGPPTNQ